MKVRTRFAPSPTGYIHIGNVYNALLSYAYARGRGGKFFIRIEDTDQKRKVKGAEEKIYEGLEWLGIIPDESPKHGGPYGPYCQSERLAIYKKYALELVTKGHAYYCFCSSDKLKRDKQAKQKRNQPPMYDQCCRDGCSKEAKQRIEKGEEYVIRMKVPDNQTIVVDDLIRGQVKFDSGVVDDQVLLKSDGFPTYHLAMVVDDHLMKTTHVVRDEGWLPSAPKHVLLFHYFGWKMPVLMHNPILRNLDKSKMGKRHGATSLTWYREQGFLPEALLNYLILLGWSHPKEKDIFNFKELIKVFDLKDVSPIGPCFDLKKLTWMNGAYIRQKTDQELFNLLKPFAPKNMTDTLIKETIPLVKERLRKLSEFSELTDFFYQEPKIDSKLLVQKGGGDKSLINKQLTTSYQQLTKLKNWGTDPLEKIIRDLAAENNWHVGKFFMALRIALTGKAATPPLFETMVALGKEKTLERLKKAA